VDRYEVLIAGAGPTGLVLALWLARKGVKVAVVDKAAQPGTTSRAMAVQARTLELYRQLGLADETIAAGKRNIALNMWVRGKRRARLSFRDAGEQLTPYPFVLVYPQDLHERLLLRHLERAGVQVQRPVELVAFEDREDYLVARLRDPDGGLRECEARFLAGCDGASSTVRQQLGAGFPGGTYDHVFYVADVQAAGMAADGEVHVSLETSDFVIMLPYTDTGRGRLIGTVHRSSADSHTGGAGPYTFDDVGHSALSSLGLRVDQVHWFSTYRVHHRVTNHYRSGQVFLVGDAAHVHSPAGGQGMNTGIGDAVNLAWKLAAVVRHEAPDSLLDSYETERLAFARKLVDTTDRMFNFITAEGNFADFVRTRIAPLFATVAYGVDTVRELIFKIVSQITISYHDSPLSIGSAGSIKAGDRLPWVEDDGVDNHAPLENIDWQVQVYGEAGDGLRAWCELHGMPMREFAWSARHEAAGFARNAHYLVRPDGHVALCNPGHGPDALAHYFRDRAYRRFCD
jgi:2-polyprenyl-6-methoxyphenol hydroxylase-like FAD-dependent oxidoreductase